MRIENQKLTSTGSFPSRRLLIVLGILATVISLPVMTLAASAATGASVSLSYSVNTQGPHSYISVVITATDSQFPNSVVVSMTSYYNGASSPYNTQSVTVSTGPRGAVSYNFEVPYEGTGSYVFTGAVSNAKGTVLLSATIDPLIEPEWK